ncbi:MAG: ribosome silencing factor [Saprospiraceae bacterium]|nr:ribosome silencing factor [Saprospiraceae bacterium]
MDSQIKVAPRKLSVEETNDLIIDSIQDIKGKNIVQLDLRHIEDAPADFFIICEGESSTQVKAISDNIYRRLKEEARTGPVHVEGQRNSRWICMDYFPTVVHIFYKETRAFYELEDLWSDAIFTEYENL